jgi:hypothetical protein
LRGACPERREAAAIAAYPAAPMLRALAVAGALIASLPTAAAAATLGPARVGFTAERILVFDGHRYVGRIWQMPGVQRHEQDLRAFTPAFILRRDSPVADLLVPQLHTVVEFALPPAFAILDSPALLRHPVGPQRVDGVMTTRYAVDAATQAGHAAGSLWLSADGIPVKCVGTFTSKSGRVSRIDWELRHIRRGRQDPRLFQVPKGFAELRPEAVAPLLGLRLAPARHR